MQSNNVNVNSSQVSAHISMIMQKETKKHFHIFKEKIFFQNFFLLHFIIHKEIHHMFVLRFWTKNVLEFCLHFV